DVRWLPVAVVIIGTAVGWGLVTNTLASWLSWQGYFLGAFGLGGKTGAWAFANLVVLVALVIRFVATWALSRAAIRDEELPQPLEPAAAQADLARQTARGSRERRLAEAIAGGGLTHPNRPCT